MNRMGSLAWRHPWARHLRSKGRQIGMPGVLAVSMIIAAGVLQWGLADVWQLQADEIVEQTRALRHQATRSQPLPSTPVLGSPETERLLPPSELRQQRLADLLELSLRQGLSSTRTEHQRVQDAARGIEKLQVVMPVRGSYASIRRFIGSALQSDPGLSLDLLRINRVGPQAMELEAELHWSLHARMEPAR